MTHSEVYHKKRKHHLYTPKKTACRLADYRQAGKNTLLSVESEYIDPNEKRFAYKSPWCERSAGQLMISRLDTLCKIFNLHYIVFQHMKYANYIYRLAIYTKYNPIAHTGQKCFPVSLALQKYIRAFRELIGIFFQPSVYGI